MNHSGFLPRNFHFHQTIYFDMTRTSKFMESHIMKSILTRPHTQCHNIIALVCCMCFIVKPSTLIYHLFSEHLELHKDGVFIRSVSDEDEGVYTCRVRVTSMGTVEERHIQLEVTNNKYKLDINLTIKSPSKNFPRRSVFITPVVRDTYLATCIVRNMAILSV